MSVKKIGVLLADHADSVEKVGTAIKVYSAKYDGTLKWILLGIGYGLEWSGKQIDKKIMRVSDLK